MAKKTSERFRLHIDFFPMMDSGCHHFVPAKAPLACPLSSHLPALPGSLSPHPLTAIRLTPLLQWNPFCLPQPSASWSIDIGWKLGLVRPAVHYKVHWIKVFFDKVEITVKLKLRVSYWMNNFTKRNIIPAKISPTLFYCHKMWKLQCLSVLKKKNDAVC